MSTNTINTNATGPTEQLAPAGRIWQTGLMAGVIAAVANVIVYAIANALGVGFNIMPADMPAPPFAAAVVVSSILFILVGTFVFTQMPRFSKRPVSTFRTVAIVALVLSFLQPLILLTGMLPSAEPVTIGTVLTLEVMHVIAGVIAIGLLTTRGRA